MGFCYPNDVGSCSRSRRRTSWPNWHRSATQCDCPSISLGIVGPIFYRPELDTGRCRMKAIVVTDEAAGTAGMTLGERPEPPAAINDVIVQVHASGFVPTEMAWP